jgi:hypothetical protein
MTEEELKGFNILVGVDSEEPELGKNDILS